jgi:hypothetical protein
MPATDAVAGAIRGEADRVTRATEKVPLSRHRKIRLSRSKAIVIAAAGALSVASAASATAATWTQGPQGNQGHWAGPAGTSDPRTHEAAARAPQLIVTDQLALPMAEVASQQSGVTLAQRAYQVRLAGTQHAIAQWQAARKRAEAAAKQAATAAAAQSTATQSPAATQTPPAAQPIQTAAATVPVASGSPQQIAEAMLGSFGWSSSQFSCLDPLWAHESGWSVSAYNAGSGAFGIPQALPGSRMASAGPDWQTDAATQIRWGLEYIKGSYGSPCGAWAHEEATGWY